MGLLGQAFLILGILVLLEGIIVMLFPKFSIKIGKSFLKNPKKIKDLGIIEIIVAIILILIGINI